MIAFLFFRKTWKQYVNFQIEENSLKNTNSSEGDARQSAWWYNRRDGNYIEIWKQEWKMTVLWIWTCIKLYQSDLLPNGRQHTQLVTT